MKAAIKVFMIVVGLAAAVVLLFSVVFPWFEANYVTDPTLTGSLDHPRSAGI